MNDNCDEFSDKSGIRTIFRSTVSPSFWEVFFSNLLEKPFSQEDDSIHLEAAMKWLCRAQDVYSHGGVSGSYRLLKGWTLPYPETTGYIIPTFIKYAKLIHDQTYMDRAIRMGDWEIDVQMENGAVRGGIGVSSHPVVFNTGMVILGWTKLYAETGKTAYLNAALRAADWLCSVQDTDGKWSKFTYLNVSHAYHARVAWALLNVFELTGNEKYKAAGEKNIKWVLSLVKDNGWIDHMYMVKDEHPFTHPIAYTLRGLLESSRYMDPDLSERSVFAVKKGAAILLNHYKEISGEKKYKFLPGRYDDKWRPASTSSCITGNAQIAIVWLLLHELTQEGEFLEMAKRMLNEIKKVQHLKSVNPGINGAIPGSFPIWGDYLKFKYPNWAAKFYADGLMLLYCIGKQEKASS